MTPYINIHSHQDDIHNSEISVRNFIIPKDEMLLTSWDYSQFFSIGIHPWFIPTRITESLQKLRHFIKHPSCVAIGESGLDKLIATDMNIQKEAFIQQMELASEHDIPLIIHCVKAWNELIDIYRQVRPSSPCIIHGFRGKPELAHELLNHGFYLSFGFKFNTDSLIQCPIDRMFLETDEENLPINTLYTLVSEIRSCNEKLLKEQCFNNLRNLNKKLQVSLKGRTFAGNK